MQAIQQEKTASCSRLYITVWRRFVDRVALKNATREIAKENKGKRKRETNRSREATRVFHLANVTV